MSLTSDKISTASLAVEDFFWRSREKDWWLAPSSTRTRSRRQRMLLTIWKNILIINIPERATAAEAVAVLRTSAAGVSGERIAL